MKIFEIGFPELNSLHGCSRQRFPSRTVTGQVLPRLSGGRNIISEVVGFAALPTQTHCGQPEVLLCQTGERRSTDAEERGVT